MVDKATADARRTVSEGEPGSRSCGAEFAPRSPHLPRYRWWHAVALGAAVNLGAALSGAGAGWPEEPHQHARTRHRGTHHYSDS